MIKTLKMPQTALNCFMGYGGTRFPHVDLRPYPLIRLLSRALMFQSAFMLFTRPVDWFFTSLVMGVTPVRVVASARRAQGLPPLGNTGGKELINPNLKTRERQGFAW